MIKGWHENRRLHEWLCLLFSCLYFCKFVYRKIYQLLGTEHRVTCVTVELRIRDFEASNKQ